MFASIGRKLNVLIGAAIAVGLLGVVAFYAREHQKNIFLQNERTVRKVTQSVIEGVQTVMLAGYADVAEHYVERLKKIEGVSEFRILRTNGLEAFKDNRTIVSVNKVRGTEDFQLRPQEAKIEALSPTDPRLRQTVSTKSPVFYYDDGESGRTLTFLWPIINEKACRKCHGGNHEVRGVLQLTSSLNAVDTEVRRTWWQASAIMGLSLLGIIVIMSVFVRRQVVTPIRQVSSAMQRVSDGDLSQEVPVFGRDELAQMATSFNTMLHELRETRTGYQSEHDKLETLIHGARDGIVVTDSSGRVVLVNPAAEVLLGKSAAAVAAAGFESILDDPERIEAALQASGNGTEMVLFNEHFLAVSVALINNPDGRLIGKAALLHDMTEEKRMEQMLRALSNTDGLTGLANRRLLDDALARELTRSLKHRRPLSILMFDVDHFKTFNDTHGHDQGDRVLKAIAAAAQECVRTVDLACRYGGEEFLVILTETDEAGACIVAERMRESVAATRVDGLQVTISIGVAGLAETGALTPEALIERADGALYAAKRAGRNRVEVAGS